MKTENFIGIYSRSFFENWDLPALTDYVTGRTLTYGDLATSVAKLHVFFDSVGLRPGDKVALCGRDSINWVLVYMATVTYGAVIVPVLAEFNPVDISHIVNHSEARLLFVGASIFENIDPDSLLNVRGVLCLDDMQALHEAPGSDLMRHRRLLNRRFRRLFPRGLTAGDIRYAERDNSEVVEINYTSGTTGFSKGVMLTGGNLAGNVCFGMETMLHFRSSRALAFLPLAHAYG